MTVKLLVELQNNIAELERLSQTLEEFCELNGITPKVLFSINLALDEVVTNIISYGYADSLEHKILIDFCLDSENVLITVSDDGRPFNPLAILPPDIGKPLEDREVGGLGIHFVRKVMDGVEYRREMGQNVLSMRKLITL